MLIRFIQEGVKMEIRPKEEGLAAAKILVETHNQICLNCLDEIANQKKFILVSSCSRVNNNGGYLTHFYNASGALAVLEEIKDIVERTDNQATIIVFNCHLVDKS